MQNKFSLPRPATLIDGGHYRLIQRDGAAAEPRFIPVTFLAYTACPAFVIVSEGDGRRRCPRLDLYNLEDVADWL
jgi:hypothetical protein